MSTLPLPVTVEVNARGGVAVTFPGRVVAMSPFSDRARRLALDFGPGAHLIRTAQDVEDLPTTTATDLSDLLAMVES